MTSHRRSKPRNHDHRHDRQLVVGATADQFARAGVFADYQARRAPNTLRRQRDDLITFAEYLTAVQFYSHASRTSRTALQRPGDMGEITYGLIAGFVALAAGGGLRRRHGQPQTVDREAICQAGVSGGRARRRAARPDPHRRWLPVQRAEARRREAQRRASRPARALRRRNR